MPTIEEFVKDLTDVTDEERAQLLAIANKTPERKKVFEGSLLRQADYSRSMNELSTEKTRLQADFDKKNQDVDSFRTTLVDARGKIEGTYKKAITERDQALQRVEAINRRIQEQAADYGYDPAEFLKDAAAPNPAAKPANEPSDLDKKYILRDDLEQKERAYALLVGELNDLNQDHMELFGKPLPKQKELLDRAWNKGVGVRKLWEEENKVSEARQTKAEKAVQERIDTATKDAEVRVRSEMLASAGNPMRQRTVALSPALRLGAKKDLAPGDEGALNPRVVRAAQQADEHIAKILQDEGVAS